MPESETATKATKKLLAAAKHATVMGRNVIVTEDSSIKFDWPGVRLKFVGIAGTSSINVRIHTAGSVFGWRIEEERDPGQEARQRAEQREVKEGILHDSRLFRRSRDLLLASGLDVSKSYSVAIWKRDDPCSQPCRVYGAVVDRNATVASLPPAPEPDRRHIEFVGDSDTVGFGNTTPKSDMLYYILCQLPTTSCRKSLQEATDVNQSWPTYLATSLKANYSVIAWSGIGAKHSFGFIPNMIHAYPRVLATDKKSVGGELGPADSVVLYLGQNDQSVLEGQKKDARLEGGFDELLRLIRSHRPLPIPIIIVVPSLNAAVACADDEDERYAACSTQIRVWKSTIEKLGGEEAGFHLVENSHDPQIELNSRQDFGMCLHWNAESHKKWANGLLPNLRKILYNQGETHDRLEGDDSS